MRIIAVDDETLALQNIVGLLRQTEPEAEVYGFSEPEDAFSYLANNYVDIIFLDIDLGELNGIELAKKCKSLCQTVNIIFVTGYPQYMMDAFQMHASGYLLKPVRITDLRAEIDNLRHPVLKSSEKRVRVQTFGYFEIFIDDQLLKFTRIKCKECLAYLIDRKGARVTYSDLSAILWEDRPFDRTVQNNTQRVISDLMKTLKEANIQELIIKSRQDIAIDTSLVECDYYAALNGDAAQMNSFIGEYMSNYSWAEFTMAELVKLKQHIF